MTHKLLGRRGPELTGVNDNGRAVWKGYLVLHNAVWLIDARQALYLSPLAFDLQISEDGFFQFEC